MNLGNDGDNDFNKVRTSQNGQKYFLPTEGGYVPPNLSVFKSNLGDFTQVNTGFGIGKGELKMPLFIPPPPPMMEKQANTILGLIVKTDILFTLIALGAFSYIIPTGGEIYILLAAVMLTHLIYAIWIISALICLSHDNQTQTHKNMISYKNMRHAIFWTYLVICALTYIGGYYLIRYAELEADASTSYDGKPLVQITTECMMACIIPLAHLLFIQVSKQSYLDAMTYYEHVVSYGVDSANRPAMAQAPVHVI